MSLVLILIGLAGFGLNLHNRLLYWDDFNNICQNPMLFPPAQASLRALWSYPYFEFYVPVTSSVWWAVLQLGDHLGLGGSCENYAPLLHGLNIAVHILNSILVFFVLRTLLARLRQPAGNLPCLFGAAFFLLHPVQVEPVAWASGLRDLLALTFSLLCLMFYFGSKGRFAARYAAASVMFALALLAKPAAAVLPLAILVLDFFIAAAPALIPLVPWAMAAGLVVELTLILQKTAQALNPATVLQRFELVFFSLGFYVRSLIGPFPLAVDYALPARFVLSEPRFAWLALASAAGFFTLGVFLWKSRERVLVCALALFSVFLLPVSGLAAFSFQRVSQVADRFVYSAMTGVALAAAVLLTKIPEKWRLKVAAVISLVLGGLAFQQGSVWRNEETLFRHAVEYFPGSSTSEGNLGHILYRQGDLSEAETHLRESLHFDSDNQESAITLGHVLEQQDRRPDAMNFYREILSRGKNWAAIHNNLGMLLVTEGRTKDAIMEYESALKIDPSLVQARFNLGALLISVGRLQEARRYLESVQDVAPGFPMLEEQMKLLNQRSGLQSH